MSEEQAPDADLTESELAAEILDHFNEEFDQVTHARHVAGASKYGPVKFLDADTLEEAKEELADLANYIRYTYIKLCMLQASIAGIAAEVGQDGGFIQAAVATAIKEDKKS